MGLTISIGWKQNDNSPPSPVRRSHLRPASIVRWFPQTLRRLMPTKSGSAALRLQRALRLQQALPSNAHAPEHGREKVDRGDRGLETAALKRYRHRRLRMARGSRNRCGMDGQSLRGNRFQIPFGVTLPDVECERGVLPRH
jgi:hypothetical protein